MTLRTSASHQSLVIVCPCTSNTEPGTGGTWGLLEGSCAVFERISCKPHGTDYIEMRFHFQSDLCLRELRRPLLLLTQPFMGYKEEGGGSRTHKGSLKACVYINIVYENMYTYTYTGLHVVINIMLRYS